MRSLALAALAITVSACGAEDPSEEDAAELRDHGWACHGATGKSKSPSGNYYVTAFGCWSDASGSHRDSGDNCVPACIGSALKDCAGLSGPACERKLNWYSADADRFGCGTRLKVTSAKNGKSAVVEVIDRGPACWVERSVSFGVLDMSYPASHFLFGSSPGPHDRAQVHVEEVSASTPLGPWQGGGDQPSGDSPDGGEMPSGSCHSDTLGRAVDVGTCVESKFNGKWWQCMKDGTWAEGVTDGAGQEGPCSVEYAL
jgi:hypothetical protein